MTPLKEHKALEDNRRLNRENTIYYLEALEAGSGQTVGRLVDITAEGIMLICETPIEVGRQFELTIQLPQEVARASEVRFSAEARWCRPALNIDFFDAGFKILHASPQDRSLIDLIIRFYSFSGTAASLPGK